MENVIRDRLDCGVTRVQPGVEDVPSPDRIPFLALADPAVRLGEALSRVEPVEERLISGEDPMRPRQCANVHRGRPALRAPLERRPGGIASSRSDVMAVL